MGFVKGVSDICFGLAAAISDAASMVNKYLELK